MTAVLLAGAVAGAGLLMLVLLLQRPITRGSAAAAALARLDADRSRLRARNSPAATRERPGEPPVIRMLGRELARRLEVSGIRLPTGLRADLAMADRSAEAHLAFSLLAAAAGGLLTLLAAGLATVLVPGLPPSTPLWVLLLGVLVGGLLPTAVVSSRAASRRRDFRHVVGSFLDLVAMNLAGGRGVPEALQSASSVSTSWAMVRIRDTLQIARLQGSTPWAALGQLGEQTRIAELRDLSAALELVADDGAKVRESLAARATSLRRRELAEAEGRAQSRSQSMLVAQLLLAVGFLIFLIYPAIVRVLGT